MKFNIFLPKLLNSGTKIKIVKFLLTHQALMSEREIASVLKVSHMSVNRTLRELAGINLMDFIAVGKAHLWKVNRNRLSPYILTEHELKLRRSSRLIEAINKGVALFPSGKDKI